MKVGIRTPSVRKSISARTTGRVKRAVRKSIDPTYGKRGIGIVKNPKKAVYNAVYRKTTVSVKDVLSSGGHPYHSSAPETDSSGKSLKTLRKWANPFLLILSVILLLLSLLVMIVYPIVGVLFAAMSVFYIFKHFQSKRILKEHEQEN